MRPPRLLAARVLNLTSRETMVQRREIKMVSGPPTRLASSSPFDMEKPV
jgi:hypothetical protein